MKNNTNKFISKMLCVALLASMVAEAPVMALGKAANTNAAASQNAINVNGHNVTSGQWVTVNNGGTNTQYNVRYVDGQAVALDLKQFTSLIFGKGGNTTAAATQTNTTAAQAAQTNTTAAQAAQTTTNAKSGSWIKNELAE